MRLVTWNCQGAFGRKQAAVLAFRPDVLIVPESERDFSQSNSVDTPAFRSHAWAGENRRKGLGVFSYGDYSVKLHETYEPRHRWVVPLAVEGPYQFTLFAVWTLPHAQSKLYVHCLFEALESYAELLRSPRVIWAGDFNNNFSLDKSRHSLKFADFVARMAELDLLSLYHLQSGSAHGEEPESTFFLYRRIENPFHIDFIFASAAVRNLGFDISLGQHAEWTHLSDHMPLLCSVNEEKRKAALP